MGGIARQLNLTIPEAERLVEMYFKAYPGIKTYIDDTHTTSLWNRLVVTPFGQRRRLHAAQPIFRKTAAYNASLRLSQNVLIQSSASTLGLLTFSALNEAIKPLGAKVVCSVYDSLEIECPVNRAAEVCALCDYYFNTWPVEQFDFLDMPIGCEGEIGYSWGKCAEVHQGVTQQEVEAVLASLR